MHLALPAMSATGPLTYHLPRTHQRRPSPGGPEASAIPTLARPQRYPGNNRALFQGAGCDVMKTVDLATDSNGTVVTLELNEFELVALAALVEQGRRLLPGRPHGMALPELQTRMAATADEFCALLGHLELLSTDE